MAWCPPASTGQRPGVHHLLRALIDEAHAAAAIVGLRQNPHDLADFAAEWLGFDDLLRKIEFILDEVENVGMPKNSKWQFEVEKW